ncbi:MAG: COX15/CtaA family protein [Polyangiales bacterium]
MTAKTAATRDELPGADAARPVAIWLGVCCLLVLSMIVLGGVTRIVHAGLSITEWRPITGIVPPLSEQAWRDALGLYRASPEGRLVRVDVDMAGFQRIYLVEWAHRLLGRAIGVVFLVPLIVFARSGRLSRARTWRLGALFALGGAQGVVGWWMVRSGLVDEPRVSPRLLAAHLLLGVTLLGGLLWITLGSLPKGDAITTPASPSVRRAASVLLGLVLATIAWGALMAGHHAGLVAPTFPDMMGDWIPRGLRARALGPRDLFDDPLTVHFVHRVLAFTTAGVALVAAIAARKCAPRVGLALLIVVAAQIALGGAVVVRWVPPALAALHQLVAMLVFAAALTLRHATRAALSSPVG